MAQPRCSSNLATLVRLRMMAYCSALFPSASTALMSSLSVFRSRVTRSRSPWNIKGFHWLQYRMCVPSSIPFLFLVESIMINTSSKHRFSNYSGGGTPNNAYGDAATLSHHPTLIFRNGEVGPTLIILKVIEFFFEINCAYMFVLAIHASAY